MAQQIIGEMELRNCLATIAGADPNGCMFTVTEVRNSDVAVAAAFGAVGAAINAAANSDKPNGYLLNYAPAGLYFVPMYYQKKTGMILAPQQNFLIPHNDITALTVVRAGLMVQISIKTASGRKFKFQTNRKLRGQEYHARNVEQFRSIYAEGSKKAQRRHTALLVLLAVLLVTLIAFIIWPADSSTPSDPGAAAGNYKAADASENLPYYHIDGVFYVRLPENFTDWTAEEIAAAYAEEDAPGLVTSDASGKVRVEITAVQTNLTDADVADTSKESGYSVTERDGVHFAKHDSIEAAEDGNIYIASTLFVKDGQKFTVTFRCPEEQSSAWKAASDIIIDSVCITEPQA